MDTAKVKELLGIAAANTTYDAQITALLPVVLDSIQKELNLPFELDEEEDVVIPVGLQSLIANDIRDELIGLERIASKSLGDYSISNDTSGIGKAKRDSIIRAWRRAGTY